jgi:hypothetical protein
MKKITIILALIIGATMLACGNGSVTRPKCSHEGAVRTVRTGHGIARQRCELHNDGLRWTQIS